ncbi:MAG: recombinase family protein [Acidobacteriota bacterium]
MVRDAEAKRFDVIVCEALDHLGRKLADIADLFDRLDFMGVKIHTLATGEVTPMHIGMLGTMAQLYISDLREKTWRGQLGRVRKGRIAGGLAYGYEVLGVDGDGRSEGGRRRINPAEAVVVRRIFEEFASGKSPRTIAKALDGEGVPGPAGGQWRDTTIRGQLDRGTGLLNNPTYIGRIEWNRVAYKKNPRTGKRIARINERTAREVIEVPDLRIIDDDLWQHVKERQRAVHIEMGKDAHGNALNRAHRRKFLLSGLLTCGVCGGVYTIVGKDRYGCANRRAKGVCTNDVSITRQAVEARVLSGLKDRLLAPELVAEFVRAYQEEARAALAVAVSHRRQHEAELESVERKIAPIVRANESEGAIRSLGERLRALERRREEIAREIVGAVEPRAIKLHPNLPEFYRRKVAELEVALNDEGIKDEAAELLRSLIARVVLTPNTDAPNGLVAELHGALAEILRLGSEGGASDGRARDGRKQKLPPAVPI